ncbi:MAG: tRNA (N(6)-L-threonylcarbamoyladenosine(37)-C(2))-methylthiotransferase MtaB [Thermacetogeniaceae bacterium]
MAFYTLGCKVNQQETAAVEVLFRERGYEVVGFQGEADVYVINTCTVTHLADRKSRQMIRRAVGRNPDAVVAVMGCYAQINPEEVLSIPGVNVVVGTQDRGRVVELVEAAGREKAKINAVRSIPPDAVFEQLPLPDNRSRTRAFLKIQDGCDQYCAYCIIPYARGPLRSLPPGAVRERVERLLALGYREIVLTGIHTSAYGRDLTGGVTLAGLLRDVSGIPGEFRLRLSSVEPADVTEELLEIMASSKKICRHLHIPLQSGDDEVLKRMGRPYTAEEYRALFDKACARIPGLAVTTDVMVGFPGETEEEFENTYRFISSLPFRDLHVFKYSPRPGTLAAAMPGQVPPEVKERRSNCLLALADQLARSFAERFVGSVMTVLVERRAAGKHRWEGLTDNYLRVVFSCPGRMEELKGAFLDVRITGLEEGDLLLGEPVGPPP